MTFNLNDSVTLTCTFAVSGTNTDPTTVSLLCMTPDAVQATYTYAGGTITKSATGVYTATLIANQGGTWWYRFTGTGTCQAAAQGTFTVKA